MTSLRLSHVPRDMADQHLRPTVRLLLQFSDPYDPLRYIVLPPIQLHHVTL